MENKKSCILLSGGMDSIALAYWLRPDYAFTIDYGQKSARSEIQAANAVCKILNIKHIVIQVDCSSLGSGDMTANSALSVAPVSEWWPFRNQMLLTFASMKAISLNISDLSIGSVSTDNSHKDGTEEFYNRISMLTQYQEGEIIISAPAINMSSVELINRSEVPLSVLFWAHSCHKSNEPCMKCNGCSKYLSTLQELGIDQ